MIEFKYYSVWESTDKIKTGVLSSINPFELMTGALQGLILLSLHKMSEADRFTLHKHLPHPVSEDDISIISSSKEAPLVDRLDTLEARNVGEEPDKKDSLN